jgi:multicomponent Na+:H+ antiporter subunit D
VGVCLKLALFPLHLWLPNAYTFAPASVSALLASTATKVAVYMLLRFFFTVFGPSYSFDALELDWALLPLAVVAVFSMSLVAMFQDRVRRMLAYSSIAQIGYMILGISLASLTGLTAGILHLVNHALIKGALFLAMGCVVYRLGSSRLDEMHGLGRTMPWTMAAFVAGGISLIGIPGTTGFVSKWYLILGAVERGWWPVAALVVIASLMAVAYIWRVVEVAYFTAPQPGSEPVREVPASLLVPTWILVLANFYFGINASLTVGAAERAALQLLGTSP